MERLMQHGTVLRVAGTMSGTSVDGVDVAVIETDGEEVLRFLEDNYREYDAGERERVFAAMGEWEGAAIPPATLVVNRAHRDALDGLRDLDLIGFHGQTLAHAPRTRGTLQVGDGVWLSETLGVPVVWDFRSDDVAAGGEGAPLAPFFHWACARWAGLNGPVAFLNLGGVGNLTWVDPRVDRPEDPQALLAFDTGPANAPINDFVQERFGLTFDRDGALASQGRVDEDLVARFEEAEFFSASPPKSLDRNDFSNVRHLVEKLSDIDTVATLTAFAVAGVKKGMRHCPAPPTRLFVTGGGRRNPEMMRMLGKAIACPVEPVEVLGLDGDMLEAQAFAYLAVRVARGLPTSSPTTTGAGTPISGGQISYPRGMSNAG